MLVATRIVHTAEELINTLKDYVTIPKAVGVPDTGAAEIHVENRQAQGVQVMLIENHLSDGSKTYDIRLV
jgi:hypothetical protein